MYRNPLVITDNVFLAKQFKIIIERQFPDINCEFAISRQSDPHEFGEVGVKVSVVDLQDETQVEAIIEKHDIVFSVHCKQLFPSVLVNTVKCINVHPGYNPYNRGWYPQVFSIVYDLPIGATIHEIDEYLDHGPIIARQLVQKYEWDTSESLYNRIQAAEVQLIADNLHSIITNAYEPFLPENEGHIYLKKDFRELCELELDEQLTMREAIDRLRALSHGSFNNAYFTTVEGKKVYLKIEVSNEG